jgi:hypothetical protein
LLLLAFLYFKLKINLSAIANKNKFDKVNSKMKKKVIKLNENDVERLVKRIISETEKSQLSEIGGYDSMEMDFQDKRTYMDILTNNYEKMAESYSQIVKVVGSILDDSLRKDLSDLMPRLQDALMKMGDSLKVADERYGKHFNKDKE